MQIIIIFICLFIVNIAYSGPLDIEDIKQQCLKTHSSTASKKYNECIKNHVNKKLTIKNNDINDSNNKDYN
tara:strand:- start:160 stop:372 length:213 start_codon:yes stop_codon:yes gene_type:complete